MRCQGPTTRSQYKCNIVDKQPEVCVVTNRWALARPWEICPPLSAQAAVNTLTSTHSRRLPACRRCRVRLDIASLHLTHYPEGLFQVPARLLPDRVPRRMPPEIAAGHAFWGPWAAKPFDAYEVRMSDR